MVLLQISGKYAKELSMYEHVWPKVQGEEVPGWTSSNPKLGGASHCRMHHHHYHRITDGSTNSTYWHLQDVLCFGQSPL